jgi:hypothetical protein
MISDENNEVEIITPEQASAILQPKLDALEAEGWIVLVQTDYMARLTREDRNLDVRVDLLGNLEMEEKPLSLVQESGQIISIIFLGVLILLVLVLLTVVEIDFPV